MVDDEECGWWVALAEGLEVGAKVMDWEEGVYVGYWGLTFLLGLTSLVIIGKDRYVP